jgi:peptidoglycan/LPS O-acetylase OafA/YrhL
MATRRHVHEVDVVRVLTFACVIAVHTISHVDPPTDFASNSAEMLLHFTREAFFCLTGFVLIHQVGNRRIEVRSFWARRFLTVGVPYLTWTVIYTGLEHASGRLGSVPSLLSQLGTNILTGTAWYHLYFLLVSMQIYLLFPLISWLVRRTAGRHTLMLGISAAVQLATFGYLTYGPPASGWLSLFVAHDDALLTSYQFYVLLGAVAAFHLPSTVAFVRAHRPAIAAATLGCAALTELWYALAVHWGRQPADAAAVLQPIMLPWSVCMIAALFVLGTCWSDRRRAGSRLDRVLSYGSDRSFGVFLVHPAVLWLLMRWQPRLLPGPHGASLIALVYLCTVAGSLAVIELLRRSPLSLALTGRRPLAGARTPARHPAAPETEGREPAHDHNDALASGARTQAPHLGNHDGDRQRVTDPLLRRRRVELQRTDRRDQARLGNLAGDR